MPLRCRDPRRLGSASRQRSRAAGGGAAVDRCLTPRRLELPSSSSRCHLSLVGLHSRLSCACSCTHLIHARRCSSDLCAFASEAFAKAACCCSCSASLSATAQQPRTTAAQPTLQPASPHGCDRCHADHAPRIAILSSTCASMAQRNGQRNEENWRRSLIAHRDQPRRRLHANTHTPRVPDPEGRAFASDC